MTRTIEGSCLCGAARFRITGEFGQFFLCHCSRCRKGTGSAHAANLFSTTARLDWLEGRDKVRTWRVPDSRHQRSFCADCGSALPREQMDGALLVVPAGSLDGEIVMPPTAHICLSSRGNWEDGLKDAPRFDGLPSS